MPHYDVSQNRYLRLFTRYVDIDSGEIHHKGFERDMRDLRDSGVSLVDSKAIIKGRKNPSPLSEFMLKYRFPYAMVDFIYNYVIHETIDPLLIRSGMFIVSEADKTAAGLGREPQINFALYEQLRTHGGKTKPKNELKLIIPAGVSLNEAKSFLDNNWREFVEPRLKRYRTSVDAPRGRIRSRDERIVRAILRLKAKGLTHTQVADKINRQFNKTYNSNNIARILYRFRHGS